LFVSTECTTESEKSGKIRRIIIDRSCGSSYIFEKEQNSLHESCKKLMIDVNSQSIYSAVCCIECGVLQNITTSNSPENHSYASPQRSRHFAVFFTKRNFKSDT
jgi:hypothetical protein